MVVLVLELLGHADEPVEPQEVHDGDDDLDDDDQRLDVDVQAQLGLLLAEPDVAYIRVGVPR